MSTALENHLRSGEIKYAEGTGYHCKICDVPLGVQPQPHLIGTQHKNKAFFVALRCPGQYPALHGGLPDIVRQALNDKVIEVNDLKIDCHSCGTALSGEKPLIDHLNSGGHHRKTEMKKLSLGVQNLSIDSSAGGAGSSNQNTNMENIQTTIASQRHQPQQNSDPIERSRMILGSNAGSVSQTVPRRVIPEEIHEPPYLLNLGSSEQPAARTIEAAGAPVQVTHTTQVALQDDSVEDKAIQSEVAAGHIEDLGGVYKCKACNMSLTGREPVLQHINGRKHRSKTQSVLPKPEPVTEVQQLQSAAQLEDDLFRLGELRQERGGRNVAAPTPARNTAQENAEIFKAMHYPKYSTDPSQVSFSPLSPISVPPFQLGSHASAGSLREQSCSPYTPPGVPYPAPSGQYPETGFPSRRASPFGMDVAESLPRFQVKKIGSYWPRPPSTYRLLTRPRGYVAVFNNHFADHPKWKRDGSEFDDENLMTVFEQMEYKVQLFPNTSKTHLLRYVDEILKNIIAVDSLIMFFLSHGKDERRFYSADQKLVDIRDIWIKLTDQNCPALKDKPKILFLNYCRGETRQTNRVYDNISEKEEDAPKDVAIVHASLAGFKAQRVPTDGTIFIHSLCQVLCESACEKDIHEIINATTEIMQRRGGTTPPIEFIDFKKFYFID